MINAHIVGILKKDEYGHWVLSSIDLFSEAAWTLTRHGRDVIYVEMAPPIEGPTFGAAMESARQFVRSYFKHYANIDDLFKG